ncbi:YlbF family regulator [Lacticigenium naphthae]|uniref:YlbF family regulator n=1 Tax=Lacticigenium naphthae TaxID=515351 RepID=UPI00041A128E|nr:YlbF family regulator [Lacticigenium naphthae]
MTVNVYDTANQLEKELRETDVYLNLKKAFAKVQADEEANPLFQEFREVQQNLQQKQMSGQEISEPEVQKAQELSGKIGNNEVINDLLEAEKQVGQMIDDVNQVILKPVRELYQA